MRKRPKTIYLWRTNAQWRKKFEGHPIIEIELPSLAHNLRVKK
jgi:hypothetical protein